MSRVGTSPSVALVVVTLMTQLDANISVNEVLPTDLAEVRRIQADLKDVLTSRGFSERDQFHIELAMEEALVNAMKHGNKLVKDKRVYLRYHISDEHLEVRIEDEGIGFVPESVPDPTAPENIERDCGRGLYMMRNFMTSVQYHGRGNVVSMKKTKSPPDDES
jgi:serine/threonine-protein kinase RsbW